MSFDDLLGRTRPLRVKRLGEPGAFLVEPAVEAGGEAAQDTYLLPRAEVPPGTAIGDEIVAFVTLDSEDRPLATLRRPKLEREDVGFLEVTDITPIGAFVDWGLPKELLVPFREQTRELRIGDRVAVGVFIDASGRLCGTMRVRELLQDGGDFTVGEWVSGEAWRLDPAIGLFVIVERGFIGLVPASEPQSLSRGEQASFRVTRVFPDKKITLSLRAMAHEALVDDAERILAALRGPTPPRVSDHTSPDDLRRLFGLSKKAYKRAAGRLLRDGVARLDREGCLVAASAGGAAGTSPRGS